MKLTHLTRYGDAHTHFARARRCGPFDGDRDNPILAHETAAYIKPQARNQDGALSVIAAGTVELSSKGSKHD